MNDDEMDRGRARLGWLILVDDLDEEKEDEARKEPSKDSPQSTEVFPLGVFGKFMKISSTTPSKP